ncbi:hypothetical protein BH10CYA1_BH10CYA1_64940 [soil metagenome]
MRGLEVPITEVPITAVMVHSFEGKPRLSSFYSNLLIKMYNPNI